LEAFAGDCPRLGDLFFPEPFAPAIHAAAPGNKMGGDNTEDDIDGEDGKV
jgi:hypothetical protein